MAAGGAGIWGVGDRVDDGSTMTAMGAAIVARWRLQEALMNRTLNKQCFVTDAKLCNDRNEINNAGSNAQHDDQKDDATEQQQTKRTCHRVPTF